jgi:DNA-binding NtrC family response regulator
VKDQLDSLVVQMYKAGVRCSDAVQEFQKAFILTVLKEQRGNQCKAAEKLGMHRNTLRSDFWGLTSVRHEPRGSGDHRGRKVQCCCDDGRLS